MSIPTLPWFGWAILAYIVLNVALDRDVGFVPLIIIGIVLASVLGSQRRPRREVPQPHDPTQGQPCGGTDNPPHGDPHGPSHGDPHGSSHGDPHGPSHGDPHGPSLGDAYDHPHADPHGPPHDNPYGQPPTAEPMPTIDVPRYPGGATSSPGSDPAVSFAQLQLGQAGRDLEQAMTSGGDAEVERALGRVQATIAQVRPSLEGVGTPQARTLRASLDGLRAATAKALASSPGAERSALVQRIAATCRTAY